MKYALLATLALTLISAQAQVKPTPGALAPIAAAPATPTAAAPGATTPGVTAKPVTRSQTFRTLEDEFDYRLKTADQASPMALQLPTRGLYLQGFGVVFTTDVELVQPNFLPMFHTVVTKEEKTSVHDRKVKHLDLLEQQMRTMMSTAAKSLDMLGPNDQIVVAVRLAYQAWEERAGLPDQIVMRADRRTIQSDPKSIKAELQ